MLIRFILKYVLEGKVLMKQDRILTGHASSQNKRSHLNCWSRREVSASPRGDINMLGLIREAQIPNYSRSLLSDMRLWATA